MVSKGGDVDRGLVLSARCQIRSGLELLRVLDDVTSTRSWSMLHFIIVAAEGGCEVISPGRVDTANEVQYHLPPISLTGSYAYGGSYAQRWL